MTKFFLKIVFNGKVRKKHKGKSVIEGICLVTSLHLVHGQNMPKKGQQEKLFCTINKGQLPIN